MREPRPYGEFDELISLLRSEGYEDVAQNLHSLLHEVAWTTSSELIGELGLAIVKFQRSVPNVSRPLRELLGRCMASVKKVWPRIENVR